MMNFLRKWEKINKKNNFYLDFLCYIKNNLEWFYILEQENLTILFEKQVENKIWPILENQEKIISYLEKENEKNNIKYILTQLMNIYNYFDLINVKDVEYNDIDIKELINYLNQKIEEKIFEI